MGKALAVLLFVLVMLVIAARAEDRLPPLDGLEKVRCEATLYEGKDIAPGWHVRVSATYPDREPWKLLYAIETDQKKALAVCGDWIDAVKKALNAKTQAEKTNK